MQFRINYGDKSKLIENSDNIITLGVLFNGDKTIDSSYNVVLVNQINKASGVEQHPNVLFPLFVELPECGVDSMQVLNDDGTTLMTFPPMKVSYRMTNSNISVDKLSDTNDRPQERLEFTFKDGSSVSDITVE